MPQSKKRKKNTVSRKPPKSYIKLSKQYIDVYETTACRIIRMANVDDTLFHKLSKRLRHRLMQLRCTPFRVHAETGYKIPKSYLKFFNSAMMYFEENAFYGNKDFKIRFLEYIEYGFPFLLIIQSPENIEEFANESDLAIIQQLQEPLKKLENDYLSDYYLFRINHVMKYVQMHVSSPIYRYYTCRIDTTIDHNRVRLRQLVHVSSFEPKVRMFKIQNERHKGYHLWNFDLANEQNEPNPVETYVPQLMMEVDDFETAIQILEEGGDNRVIPVYVQAHVIHRMRQRLDTMDIFYINQTISRSFQLPGSLTAKTGQRLLKAIDIQERLVGYFPFIIENGAVLVRSFLPLSSPITPEGHQLQKILGIQLDDSKYIGLDKLSFFAKTDFGKLPHLKEALEKANMWHLTEILPVEKIERREDQMLERFFEGSKIKKQRVSVMI